MEKRSQLTFQTLINSKAGINEPLTSEYIGRISLLSIISFSKRLFNYSFDVSSYPFYSHLPFNWPLSQSMGIESSPECLTQMWLDKFYLGQGRDAQNTILLLYELEKSELFSLPFQVYTIVQNEKKKRHFLLIQNKLSSGISYHLSIAFLKNLNNRDQPKLEKQILSLPKTIKVYQKDIRNQALGIM